MTTQPASALALAAAILAALPSAAAEFSARASSWQATLDRVAPAVVVLRVSVPRSFDTEIAAYETATGFVVDAERGLILTNRHVVKPGPTVAEAVFLDNEEVPVQAVYRDPVHDFGFFRYRPSDVKFMETTELALVPENARVGMEIRVVGNDAGEKLSILAGTLARLDREAPHYGRKRYNDFNTFYLQAASGTSGGSSGSPVVDIDGSVVALNAGGSRKASSSFYLPLDRVVRALEFVREGALPPRGTLQTVFRRRPYDELRRLGLRPETEAAVRAGFPDETGMLVVDQIVPDGPADGKLQVGDVLVRVSGEPVVAFGPLESALDGRVNEQIAIEVERGGEALTVTLEVQDLYAITPASYLEVGGAVIHPLSYQQARNGGVPVSGLYLAAPGYTFGLANVPRGAVITAVGGEPVPTLESLEERLAALPDGARVPVRYFDLKQQKAEVLAVIALDRRWFAMQRCARDQLTGVWSCAPSPGPSPPVPRQPVTTRFSRPAGRPARALAPSLVMVEFDVPYRIDGVHGDSFEGAGLVVDAERGLVIVDRDTVPIALGDLRITFAASVEVPGEVVYLHPVHNLAVIGYDPALLGETPVRSAEFRTESLSVGDETWLVGLSRRHRVVSRKTRVSRIEAPTFPIAEAPRFREAEIELIALDDATATLGGVLADEKGRVLAHWGSFSTQSASAADALFAGIPAARVLEIVEPLRAGRPVGWRDLGVELGVITLAEARNRGLGAAAASRLEADEGRRARVLAVERLTAGTDAARLLEVGDLLLSIDGRAVVSFEEVERAAQAEPLRLSVLRDGEELALDLTAVPLEGRGTDRCLLWAGTLLQNPHRALAEQRGLVPKGVYVSWLWYGSPANRYGLHATRRIVAVDGVEVSDLDAFLAQVADLPDRQPVRLRVLDLKGREQVITLKLDLKFWPTVEIRRGERGWRRIERPAGSRRTEGASETAGRGSGG